MIEKLLALAEQVRTAVLSKQAYTGREILRREHGGDPHYGIDEIAEKAIEMALRSWNLPIAYYSEDRGFIRCHEKPEFLLIIDPIDGTRPAIANFESCCFSVAVVPYSACPKFKDIKNALILELKSGNYFYADADANQIEVSPSISKTSLCSKQTDVESMFWSIELTAHPVKQLIKVYGDLIDNSVTLGAVFVFTSSSYSLTRIITGQLDSHVDIGHRIIQDYPKLIKEFEKVGRGKIVTLFPYDIAAAAFILIKSGGVATDAYGRSLDNLPLITDKSIKGQCSLIAASNKKLHKKIMNQLKWNNLK